MIAKWYISGMSDYVIGEDNQLYHLPVKLNLKAWEISNFAGLEPILPCEIDGEKGYYLTKKLTNETEFLTLDYIRPFLIKLPYPSGR